MKKFFLILFCSLPLVSTAQQAQVVKVQGNRAIVVYPPGETPRMGQILTLGEGVVAAGPKGNRANSIAFTAELSFLNNSSTNQTTTTLATSGQYGWNKIDYEWGPKGTFSYSSSSGTSATIIGVGAFGDYNLVPNLMGQSSVYGGTASLMIGQAGAQSGNVSTSTSLILLQAGGVYKWYALGSSATALRFELVYQYLKGLTGQDFTRSGLAALGGLQVYF